MIRESELGEQFASDCVIRQPVWQLKGSCESCAHLQQLPKDDRSTERPGRHVALESGFATGSQVYGPLYQYRRYDGVLEFASAGARRALATPAWRGGYCNWVTNPTRVRLPSWHECDGGAT